MLDHLKEFATQMHRADRWSPNMFRVVRKTLRTAKSRQLLPAKLLAAMDRGIEKTFPYYFDGYASVNAVKSGRFVFHCSQGFVEHYLVRDFDRLTRSCLQQYLKTGSTFVDVGAHLGWHTLDAACIVGSTGRILSFEPGPENFEILTRNVAVNHFGDRVETHPFAIGSTSGTLPFWLAESSDNHGFYQHPLVRSRGTMNVPARRLDDVVDCPVDLVKIDVEGSECEVLEGMREVIARSPNLAICIEWNPQCLSSAGRAPRDLVDQLHALGFSIRRVFDEEQGREMDFHEALQAVDGNNIRRGWYVNIVATR